MYELYMRQYMQEAMEEMKKYSNGSIFSEEEDPELLEEEAASKAPVYKENYYLRDHLQKPYVSTALTKKKVQQSIIEFTGRFMDDHAAQLSTSGPVYMFTFSNKETSFFYDTFNITPDEIVNMYTEMINETYYGKISAFYTGWVKSAPHKMLLTAILIDAIQNNLEDIITCCEYLWAFCEYPLIYREFWKTGVKEDVMNYTIEHLGTKYKIKQMNNLQELLKYDATSAVQAHMDALKKGADNTYLDFMQRMRNQIKSKMKNIAIAYYKNTESNATQHNNVSQFDDGEIADQEGYTTNAAQVIDKTIVKFTTGTINKSMVKIAADNTKVDADNVAGYIAQINATKNNKLPKLIENIIISYFSKNPTNTSIGSGEFLNFGLALYRSIGTSKDPMLHEIKDILNYWMYTIVDIRSQYQREPTIINYTRAIYNYIILMIMYYN